MLRQIGSQNPPLLSQESSCLFCASSGAPQRPRAVWSAALVPGRQEAGAQRTQSLRLLRRVQRGPCERGGAQEQLGRGPEGGGLAEAAHELARPVFVLTVVIFHVGFNHVVITQHQNHFFPKQISEQCRTVAVQYCGCRPGPHGMSILNTNTYTEAGYLPHVLRGAVARSHDGD